MGDLAERMAEVRFPGVLRRQQVAALAALEDGWGRGRSRAWVALPPGAGKTVVGLEAARRLGRPVVVLVPNAAVQGQWVRAWRQFGPPVVRVGTERDLSADVTVLTSAALASATADDEVDADGEPAPPRPALALHDRLHVHGRALVRLLQESGPVTLVLDECAHLVEAWGHLLPDLLDLLPEARVVGLSAGATAPHGSDPATRVLGPPVHVASVPAGVRDGDVAPFAALARLVPPTDTEARWLAEESERFRELVADLLDPHLAPTGFLAWLDARFVRAVTDDLDDGLDDDPPATGGGDLASGPSWADVERDEPDLAAAVLRVHAAGLLALPPGARLREEHRRPPTGGDWALLADDYARGCLLPADDAWSRDAFDRLRAGLPAVGWVLTRGGLRQGRTPVDRLLARSEARTLAAVEVLAAEHRALGERLRAVVLADHERATATLPAGLVGVLPPQAGSARHLLARLVADRATAPLRPVLVTARAVAADPETARALVAFVQSRSPRTRLDAGREVTGRDHPSVVEVTGDWTPLAWAGHVTAFLEAGHSQLLVSTRSLLGEGWDARGVNVLVDLTTAVTSTAAVSTRGRALRADPGGTGEVAHVWSVVCVAEGHPRASADWDRFVRKHTGLFALDPEGDVVEGVAAVHPELTPASPPPVADLARLDAELLGRVGQRAAVRAGWRVGSAYDDQVAPVLRIARAADPAAEDPAPRDPVGDAGPGGPDAGPAAAAPSPPPVLPAARGYRRHPAVPDPRRGHAASWAALLAGAAVPLLLGVPEVSVPAGVAAAAPVQWTRSTLEAGRLARTAARPPDVRALACAVADGLREAGVTAVGAEGVDARVDSRGVHRVSLRGAGPSAGTRFAEALQEVLEPVGSPRYLVPRWAPAPVGATRRELRRAGRGWLARRGGEHPVVHHAVPAVLGGTVRRARAFGSAWSRWVSADAEPLYTGSDAGRAVLRACRGVAPLAVTTVQRTTWT